MRHYEMVTILSPMLNQDEASAAWDEIKSFIANRDGEITAEQIWGTRRLAYPIRKGNYNFLEGSYYLSTFTVENSFNRELENYLRLDERVLRSLVVSCEGPLPDKSPPGPLNAPSRYIPPGRTRRGDGGGPIPEAAGGGFGDRRPGPPPAGAPGTPPATPDARPAAAAETPAAPTVPEPAAEATPPSADAEPATIAEAPAAPAVPEAPPAAPAAIESQATATPPATEAPASESAAEPEA